MPYPLTRALVAAIAIATSASAGAARAQLPNPPIVHPLCVQQLATMIDFHFQGASERPVATAECNRRFADVAVEQEGDVALAAAPGTGEVRRPFYQYRVVGRHEPDIALLRVAEGGGGTGVFSALVFVAGWPDVPTAAEIDERDAMRQVGLLEGGDRCNGGIAEASVAPPATLRLGERITPFDLFTFRSTRAIRHDPARGLYEAVENPDAATLPPRLAELEPYDDLDTAAASCIGVATTEFDLEAGTAALVSITVTRLIDEDPDRVARHRHQACFNRVVATAIPSFPQTLSPAEVTALAETFETECLR